MTVTTLRDRLENVERFVARNLAGGVDHLVVVVDDPTADGQSLVTKWLNAHPNVTCVRGNDDWWRGRRPRKLNKRQHANANAVKHALSALPWAGWLAHIDGDEVLSVDRSTIAAIEPQVLAMRFGVFEIAADGAPADQSNLWFKRQLTDEELAEVRRRGLIRRPANRAYFRGHLVGKCAVRVDAAAWMSCHDVFTPDGREVPVLRDPRLRVFHLESVDIDDFERKWRALLSVPGSPPLFGSLVRA